MARRVLLITYYFPPSGGPGVQRALKFSGYLPAFGWEPTVVTVRPEDAAYPDLDPTLGHEVPASLRVERTRAFDPYTLYARLLGKDKQETVGVGFNKEGEADWKQRLAMLARANIFLPDARVGWVPYALARARKLVEAQPFDAVVTTSPPHSAHLVGRALARQYGLPWIADFRDPWTDISYYRELPLTPMARRLDARMERSVLRRADAVVAVGPTLRTILARKTDRPIHVIHNGFDERDFEDVAARPSDRFVLAHTGNLSGQQNPEALWKVLGRLVAAGEVPALRLRMVGNVDPLVRESMLAHGLERVLEEVPYVPHAEAIGYMAGASLLLLCINRVPDAECILTGKIFEYLASGRPVLGVGPAGGDAAAVLRETSAGELFGWDDVAGIERAVRAHYAAWVAGRPLAGAQRERAVVYSRRHETGLLAGLLDEVARARTQASR